MKDNALYLEVDEDITSAIDKLSKAEGESVQIVVPKRSTMLQSIINLKLLKKAAAEQGKELVVVTNDRVATDLAGRVGLAVAPSLGAKPVIKEPDVPEELKSEEEIVEADDPEPPPLDEAEPAPKPVRRLALLKRKAVKDVPVVPAAAAEAEATDEPDEPAGRTIPSLKRPTVKVPSFHKLQTRVLWVGAAVFLVLIYTLGMYLFASAKVTLYANGTKVGIDTTFAVDPATKTTDAGNAVLAGQTVTVNKDLSGSFTPSGKKDVGTKATGSMTVYNEYDTDAHTLVSGTRFQAPDGKVFRTTQDVNVPGAVPGLSGGKFTLNPGKSDAVTVEADQSGDSYNEGPQQYTIMAYAGDMKSKIYGKGGQMAGGTSKTVTVTTQADVDSAKAALLDKDKDDSARDIKGRLPDGYVALPASQNTTVSEIKPAPAVDAEGSTGQLTMKVTYTVLAVKESDYQSLVQAQELKQIGKGNQIYDDGLSDAQVTASDKDASGKQTFHLTTDAYGGAKLDKAAIAKQLSGKKFGDASDLAGRLPGVNKVDISLAPGWATSLPGRADKIHINIQVAAQK
jgi:hypothetical protein